MPRAKCKNLYFYSRAAEWCSARHLALGVAVFERKCLPPCLAAKSMKFRRQLIGYVQLTHFDSESEWSVCGRN